MPNNTTIKVNGMTINISNKSTESVFDIDKESKALESLALDISKSVEAFNIISNVKAMEAFGYQTTEGFGDKLKAGAKVVWEKIKQFFINLGKFIKNAIAAISNMHINAQLKKIQKNYTDPEYKVERYTKAIMNNQDSDKGKRMVSVIRAQKIFGEDFSKPFDPVQDAVDAVSFLNSESMNPNSLSDGFKEAHTRLNVHITEIKDFIENKQMYALMYSAKSLLIAAINESKCAIIDNNVNKRLSELGVLNDRILKNVTEINATVDKFVSAGRLDFATVISPMRTVANDLTTIGGYIQKLTNMLTKVKPSISDFYKYLNEVLVNDEKTEKAKAEQKTSTNVD